MKKLMMMVAFFAATYGAFAQTADLRRKIEVTGIAEKEVTPDIINVSVSLREYMDGKKKISISELEKQLEKAVAAAGVAKEDFTVNNVSSWNMATEKKKNPDFLVSKQYSIKFRELNKYNQILSKIDPKGIQSTNIDSYDYSKINELKKELKIQALLSAKEKATYLVTALGDKLGGVINISETDNSSFPQARMYANMSMRGAAEAGDVAESDIDFKKIKLSFQINAVFEIK
ncbi:SIMPL domain-containing protein [Mucilaginibacter defluvii]|uniref:SIMPL domain-containing protein n=1 Tax=Mucilaginibacter defluvii TaxID=1196019 RepID=A0ABP9G4R5_9SPHI